ncbi:hypothetical protein TWF694_011309 [Orbilia ellipsospora]|uniref:Uncharacterized protein n=1 Tax=Orbilia ellipsospora TaxID=2528407 RepID=A0AAV9X4V8_9PEZI
MASSFSSPNLLIIQRRLRNLILGNNPPSDEDFQHVYNIISEVDTPIIGLLDTSPENRHFREAFLANPDEALPRLVHLLRPMKLLLAQPRNTRGVHPFCQLDTTTLSKLLRVLEAFTQHVIIGLAAESIDSFDHGSTGYQHLVQCVLELYIPLASCASIPLKYLRELFSKLLSMPDDILIMEKLAADEHGAGLLKLLVETSSLKGIVLTRDNSRLLGDRLARQINCCIASHGSEIEDTVILWNTIESVYRAVKNKIIKIERTSVPGTAGNVEIVVDQETKDLFNLAKIAIPYNLTTARWAIETLSSRYQDLIAVMLSSFPCSTCQVGLLQLGSKRGRYRHSQTSVHVPKLDLNNVNVPLGAFPIHLSEIAMRELKSARMDGTLSQILQTIQKLADGCWELEPDLSRVTEKSRKRRTEPVLRSARWCGNGFILWERGIGRVTKESGQWIQIVRVLRIGLADDLKAALSAAQKAQRAYSDIYRKATALRLQNADRPGILIPKIFIGKDAIGLEVNSVNVTFKSTSSSPKLTVEDALILHKALCIGKKA